MRTASARGGHAPIDALDARETEGETPVRPRIRVDVEHAARHRAAAELGHELRGAGQHVGRRLDVSAALESVGGVGRQPERA